MNDTQSRGDVNLEPRVAKLEVSLDRLTEDVRSLASVVRDQGSNVERQLTELTVAVTQAAGPRKTDWSLLISFVLLVMAIGSAVFWPLHQTVNETKRALESLDNSFQSHGTLQSHPVGQALVQRLELQLKDHVDVNERELQRHTKDESEMHSVIEKNLNKHVEYIQKIHDLELAALRDKVQLHDDRLYGRVVKLEDESRVEVGRLKDELQMWRLKTMGVVATPSISTHTHEDTGQTVTTRK